MADLSPETGPYALNAYDVTVCEDRVTVGSYPADAPISNESAPKLHRFVSAGAPDDPATRLGRVSCNRGEQSSAAVVAGGQVVWLDSTTGSTDVVTRARSAGRCD
ncbi:hypothetical protein ACIBAG_00745 [Streptomyces sp. NPDC051243]|uniref:hypothetical protein n=1 Tax=Streptomyces sp. NPDC051243 TaxID=3365646 RepID=UPI0037B8EC76